MGNSTSRSKHVYNFDNTVFDTNVREILFNLDKAT